MAGSQVALPTKVVAPMAVPVHCARAEEVGAAIHAMPSTRVMAKGAKRVMKDLLRRG